MQQEKLLKILDEIKQLTEEERSNLFFDFLKIQNKDRFYHEIPEVIVCAANRIYDPVLDPEKKNPKIILCTRHGDPFYHEVHDLYEKESKYEWRQLDQGFITNKRRFVNRKEALQIALNANQVIRLSSSYSPDMLFSEDLY